MKTELFSPKQNKIIPITWGW